jgi:outer membrane protein assembly factor BamB
MRHDRRNTGATSRPARYTGDRPWTFRTGRGIFSTPVLGPDGAVYFGSADGCFYALERDGSPRWSFQTAGIIDSAALLSAGDVTVGSGDGYLYRFRTTGPGDGPSRLKWRFAAQPPEGPAQQVSWWEGNVGAGPDGLVLAGNTAGHAYALHDDGTPAWIYPTGNAVWTAAALGEDGVSYWGSLDFCVHAVDREGRLRWSVPTFGFVVSSPALALDGTLYVGSFDGHLYALDAATGAQRWSFPTGDNIYSSPALLEVDGRTRSIIVGSSDGSVYAIGRDGTPLWRFDTGAVVRSSPVISRSPSCDGWIAYVGSSNGVLYAIDAERGTCRWSYDLTRHEPALADRNSLNGSPALGDTGVYIGSEDGSMWYVPYDFPIHDDDPRGRVAPGEPFPQEVERFYVVTPGGATLTGATAQVGASAVLALRLVVRRSGVTLDAELASDLEVTCTPDVAIEWRRSGDGHYLFVVPDGFWAAGVEHVLRVRARWSAERTALGGAVPSGELDQVLTFVVPSRDARLPLSADAGSSTVLLLQRLSVALPSFAASVNQIGFDSYDWLVATAALSERGERTGAVVLLVRGAKRGTNSGWALDPASQFRFAVAGVYDGDALNVTAHGVDLPFSFGDVPMERFDLRFQFDDDLVARPGASMYAETVCADVPFYGPLITEFTRLADAEGRMSSAGTFLMRVLDPGLAPPRALSATSVASVNVIRPTPTTPGSVAIAVSGIVRPDELSVLLIDAETGELLAMPASAKEETRSIDGVSEMLFVVAPREVFPELVDVVVLEGVSVLERRAVA